MKSICNLLNSIVYGIESEITVAVSPPYFAFLKSYKSLYCFLTKCVPITVAVFSLQLYTIMANSRDISHYEKGNFPT